MLRAGHRLQERIYQTADIVFSGNAGKREKQMAAALCTGGLVALIRDATQSPEWTAEIDRILAAMLTAYADCFDSKKAGDIAPDGFKIFETTKRLADIRLLADQYLSLHRERPLVIPGAVQGDPIEETVIDVSDLDITDLSWLPPELQALAAEMLADED
jgi:hypothetical protein